MIEVAYAIYCVYALRLELRVNSRQTNRDIKGTTASKSEIEDNVKNPQNDDDKLVFCLNTNNE